MSLFDRVFDALPEWLIAKSERLPVASWNFANVTEMRYFLATTTATQSLAREKGIDEERIRSLGEMRHPILAVLNLPIDTVRIPDDAEQVEPFELHILFAFQVRAFLRLLGHPSNPRKFPLIPETAKRLEDAFAPDEWERAHLIGQQVFDCEAASRSLGPDTPTSERNV